MGVDKILQKKQRLPKITRVMKLVGVKHAGMDITSPTNLLWYLNTYVQIDHFAIHLKTFNEVNNCQSNIIFTF